MFRFDLSTPCCTSTCATWTGATQIPQGLEEQTSNINLRKPTVSRSCKHPRPDVLAIHDPVELGRLAAVGSRPTKANLRTKILDVRGFDSSIILISRGGILMSIGNSPEMLSQAILDWIIFVGRLGVKPGGLQTPNEDYMSGHFPQAVASRVGTIRGHQIQDSPRGPTWQSCYRCL